MAISPVILRTIVLAATGKRVRKALSVLIAAILIPIILLILMIAAMFSEAESANNSLLDCSFAGAEIPEEFAEQREAIKDMREWLGELNGTISEYEGSLDGNMVRAAFYCLNFGGELGEDFDYEAFCKCFDGLTFEQLEVALQRVSEHFPQYEITETITYLIQHVYGYLNGRQDDKES